MIEFMFHQGYSFQKMVQYLGDRSISEVLVLFLSYENMQYGEKNPDFTELKLEMVEMMLNNLCQTDDVEVNPTV
jgi:hypothetical protein